jgi:hypothetical protein
VRFGSVVRKVLHALAHLARCQGGSIETTVYENPAGYVVCVGFRCSTCGRLSDVDAEVFIWTE